MVPYGSTASERTTIARSAAFVATAVALLVAASLTLHLPGAQRWTLAAVAVAALAVAAATLGFERRATRHLLLVPPALTAALIGVAVASGGGGAEAYGWLFALVVLHACAFQPLRWAAPTLALCIVAEVAGLLGADRVTPPATWALGPGTMLLGGLFVGRLVGAIRESAADAVAVSAMARGLPGTGDVATAACEALAGATGADVTILLELLEADAGLQVTGMIGATEAGLTFTAPGVREALQRCVRAGSEQELRSDGRLLGLAQPVLVDGRVVAVMALAWTAPRRRLPARVRTAALLVASEAGVALDRLAQADRDRERMMLEVNDTIVQGLAVAKMAIQAGQSKAAVAAIDDTLTRARGLITQQLDRLSGRGDAPLQPGDFARSTAASVASD